MKLIRNALAYPFYFVAFVLHLLCAGVTVIGQKIAGEDLDAGTKPSRSHNMTISVLAGTLFTAGALGISAVTVLVYQAPETPAARLEPVKHPMRNDEFAKAEFSQAQLAAVLPNIRIVACIFSENVVRHYVRPALVSLPSCREHDFHVTIAENLIDVSVSGVATIENAAHPFVVTLQHNPPSVTEDGLIVTAIDVSDFPPRGPEETALGE